MTNEEVAASEEVIAVIEGPQGSAEILEILGSNRRVEYEVRFKGQSFKCESLGEAYIEAGNRAGTKT